MRPSSAPDGAVLDPGRNRYPYCLVFGPLPIVTWALPFVGHLGIGDSQGRIHDFAGSRHVTVDDFMVGPVTRFYRIDPRTCSFPRRRPGATVAQAWDDAIGAADDQFGAMTHNIVTNNCHHHAARALQNMGQPWSVLHCWFLITFCGSFVSASALVRTYAGFVVVVVVVVVVVLAALM